ncbi:MAG: ATP-dependent zinc metalloprotease FtsH [Clostridia bacterium]|nr:ATP-dependent zinc metalloprotease FtsH [Clostridia bacterium]
MNDPKKKKWLTITIIAFIAMVIINQLVVLPFVSASGQAKETTYDFMLRELEKKNITHVEINGEKIYFKLKESKPDKDAKLLDTLLAAQNNNVYVTTAMTDLALVERLYQSGAEFTQVNQKQMSPIVSMLLSYGCFILIYLVLMRVMMKKMGGGGSVMSFGKSNARIVANDKVDIRFTDVAGQEEAKENLKEIVDFLHDPKKYEQMGAVLPKGALLVGPPGTGKTLIAKAVAGEAHVPFFSISGSEFVEMFVGMGAAKVRDLFKQAKEKAPCIIFIDEIDAVGKKRDTAGIGGNDEREQTLNQLLSEMDGFDGSKGVILLAATNRPETLDPALLRPGRFDRRVPMELPDQKGREAVLRVHAKKVKMADTVDLVAIARSTPGASGADLANLINESALQAVRAGHDKVQQEDIEASVDVVLAGQQRKSTVISPREKQVIAYHEVGHALTAALQDESAPVHKITIIPRTSGALGFTMQLDEEERFLHTKPELTARLVTLCGGRAAEMLVFGKATTGAANDIEQATRMARAMVTRYGMSDSFGMVALEANANRYLGGDGELTCSGTTAARIDDEVIALVQDAFQQASKIIAEHWSALTRIADQLIRQENMSGEEFKKLLDEELETKRLAAQEAAGEGKENEVSE